MTLRLFVCLFDATAEIRILEGMCIGDVSGKLLFNPIKRLHNFVTKNTSFSANFQVSNPFAIIYG